MNLNEHVFDYCERTTAAFWSEPVNAISNASFLLAAWAIWRMLAPDRAAGRRTPVSIAFTTPLMVCIGLGSFAFHTIGTRWAQVLDVAPIGLYVLWYLGSYLLWFHRRPIKQALLGVGAFIVFLALFIAVAGPYIPNKSGTYIPVLLLLIGITATLRRSPDAELRPYAAPFAWSTLVFAISLTARTLDERVCGALPTGTHFLWHLGDGLLVYLTSRTLINHWHARTATTHTQTADPAGTAQPVSP
ncbi:hypothetical protein C7C46_02815 [Streptomyces tateyamensis]|uniref:Ceramidase n=1 Tax=Streptomyces tateyamensis TaxID=565073 RepID=A0A2V4NMD5_9ACTN|nr:ceramidase domain-containing protein [Streptomyces tateyamensis]PYC87698.1 hypothetical protein C7C46_02815 [Streptomyces tateyamensis]